MHPKEETTYVMIKPDGVRRGLTGEIIRRIEQRGLKLVALSMERPTRAHMDAHYPKDRRWITRLGEKTKMTYEKYGYDLQKEMGTTDLFRIGRSVRGWLLAYMTSGPIVKMMVKGVHAIDMVRKLAGDSQPSRAEMGTIRGDFSVDSAAAANRDHRAIHNLLHASETPEEARHEIRHWFRPSDLHDYRRVEEL